LGLDYAIVVIKLGDYVSIFIYGIFYVLINNEGIMGIKSAAWRRLDGSKTFTHKKKVNPARWIHPLNQYNNWKS
jgi:hypothetical protein